MQVLPNSKLIDQYSRNLNYLRISITDRCNLHCMYCVPREDIPRLRHEDILSYEEILRLVKIGVSLGISKVRITGGEPLVRKGVYHFLEKLTRIEGLSDASLTTNGVFLKDNILKIKSAGINRINISLDTLDPKKYLKITGHDKFDQVWSGIKLAREAGFAPIKLNVVALKGINEDELVEFARLSLFNPYHVRFIEHMPIGTSKAKKGIKQRLNNHLRAQSSFVKSYFNGDGARLREKCRFKYIEIDSPRIRSLLEAYTIGSLCPAHIGLGDK